MIGKLEREGEEPEEIEEEKVGEGEEDCVMLSELGSVRLFVSVSSSFRGSVRLTSSLFQQILSRRWDEGGQKGKEEIQSATDALELPTQESSENSRNEARGSSCGRTPLAAQFTSRRNLSTSLLFPSIVVGSGSTQKSSDLPEKNKGKGSFL